MDIKALQKNWDAWGEKDPLYAILTDPEKRGGKWDIAEFFASGVTEISSVLRYLEGLGIQIHRKNCLDFGCGVGRLSQALANSFESVIGIDIAPSMVARARQLNQFGTRVEYRVNGDPDLRTIADRTSEQRFISTVGRYPGRIFWRLVLRL